MERPDCTWWAISWIRRLFIRASRPAVSSSLPGTQDIPQHLRRGQIFRVYPLAYEDNWFDFNGLLMGVELPRGGSTTQTQIQLGAFHMCRFLALTMMGLLWMAVVPAQADSFTYTFTSDHCTGNCSTGAPNMGTIVVTDAAGGGVDVTVNL